MNESLVPLRYRDNRKRVINKIRRFQGESIVSSLIARLHEVEVGGFEEFRRQPPWRLLLLLKWTYIHGQFANSRLPVVTPPTLNGMINDTSSIEEHLLLPSEHPDFYIFLRRVAYQQFWFQDPPQRAHLARPSLLFRRLPSDDPLAQRFLELTGVAIDDFCRLTVAIASPFLGRRARAATRSFFGSLDAGFSSATVDKALSTVSRAPEELAAICAAHVPPDSYEHYEYHERTPLLRYPLLHVEDRFWLYNIPVLMRGIETAPYDILRADNAASLMNRFGDIFESYVRRGVVALGLPFDDEATLKRKHGAGKVMDFAVTGREGTVLIDAKGVELQSHAMVSSNPEFITRQADNSILKGLTQAAELSRRMKLSDQPYVVLVTYKPLYLGSCTDFLRYADKSKLGSTVGDPFPLDASRVFFVSIHEFDYLVQGLSSCGIELPTFLGQLAARDATRDGKRMSFMQHINDLLKGYKTPQYLEDEFDEVIAELGAALPAE